MTIEGRRVRVGAWRYQIRGLNGCAAPVLLLDTDLDGNDPADRALTGRLHGGDARYRLAQELVLGIGGVRMLAGDSELNLTRLALGMSHYVNGVARRHGEVTRGPFPLSAIDDPSVATSPCT